MQYLESVFSKILSDSCLSPKWWARQDSNGFTHFVRSTTPSLCSVACDLLKNLVDSRGLEPLTPSMSRKCSNQILTFLAFNHCSRIPSTIKNPEKMGLGLQINWWTRQDSNLWPFPCQGNALTKLSYGSVNSLLHILKNGWCHSIANLIGTNRNKQLVPFYCKFNWH